MEDYLCRFCRDGGLRSSPRLYPSGPRASRQTHVCVPGASPLTPQPSLEYHSLLPLCGTGSVAWPSLTSTLSAVARGGSFQFTLAFFMSIENWWATTQLLIRLTSGMFWLERLYHLVNSWQRPPGWNVLLVSIINTCVVAHLFTIGISST